MIFKDESLKSYQLAVRESVEKSLEDSRFELIDPPYKLTFWLWRKLEQADVNGRKHRDHQSDATNMQKALEDALQNLLIGNDRDVDDIRTVVMDQGPDTIPGIVIQLEDSLRKHTPPSEILDARHALLEAEKNSMILSSNNHIQEEMF
jgi:Holliday junction resolvase RusA-like endonuclease